MFTYKRFIGFVLVFGAVCALCSCDAAEEVPESSLPETSESSSATESTGTSRAVETDAPKIVFSGELPKVCEPSIVKVDMSEQSVMGFDEWYGECETDEYGFSCWTFYNADDEVIGEQFGWDCADYPRVFIRDFDGDGVNDLLCADTFNADGANRLYIYRMNNGVIEEGFVDYMSLETKYGLEGELCVMAYNEYYDESSDRMFFEYYYAQSGDGIYDITLDDFTFNEYEYIAY